MTDLDGPRQDRSGRLTIEEGTTVADTQRTEASGWTLDVARWRDEGGLRPSPPPDPDAQRTLLADVLPLEPDHDGKLRVAVTAPGEQTPSLVAHLGYYASGGFGADALLVPETGRVFVGAGTRVVCYSRADGQWCRQWEREIEAGFWGLARHGEMIVMSAELELAAWSPEGERRWSTWVEPPWGYEVEGDRVHLDVMGKKSLLDLRTGSMLTDQGGAARRLVGRLGGLGSRD